MPNRITRKVANELSKPAKCRVDVYNKRLQNYESFKKHEFYEKTCKCVKPCSCPYTFACLENQEGEVKETEEKPLQITREDPERCKEEKYIPGDLTEDHQKLDTFPILEEELCKDKENEEKAAFPPYKTYISPQPDVNEVLDNPPHEMKENEELTPFQQIIVDRENNTQPPHEVITHKIQETTEFLVKNEQINPTPLDYGVQSTKSRAPSSKSSKNTMDYCQEHGMYKRHPREVKSYVDTMKNFELAKELHKVNLEHEPLPDMVPKEFFVQLDKRQVPPICEKSATAIGWKGYKGFGATRCTKLKVFRPKTSPEIRKFEERQDSICSFDKKWRFIRQNKVNPMDLAICWDLTPENPLDEPKKATHIDGTNGSIAPAVFSMVETPRDKDRNDRSEPVTGRNPPAVFAAVQQHEDVMKIGEANHIRPHTTQSTTNLNKSCSKCDENYNQLAREHLKRAQSAYNLNARQHQLDGCHQKSKKFANNSKHSKSSGSNSCQKLCCSSKIFNQRLCVACELKSLPEKEPPPKEEYKQAFRAGVPNSKSSSGSSHSSQMQIKVPKPKIPYTKKNYSIRSLSAPFALNKVREREDYPEHWRLASVYQHSYKPIHLRKKSLLASIFQ